MLIGGVDVVVVERRREVACLEVKRSEGGRRWRIEKGSEREVFDVLDGRWPYLNERFSPSLSQSIGSLVRVCRCQAVTCHLPTTQE